MLSFLSIITVLVFISSTSSSLPNSAEEQVDRIVTAFNYYLTDNNLMTYSLPDFVFESYFINVAVKNGYIGKLSTISRKTEPNLLQNSYNIDYKVTIGLEKLFVEYDFNSTYFWFFHNSGHVSLPVDGNSFLLMGTVENTNSSEECKATWSHAVLMEFGDVRVDILPHGIWNYILKGMFQSVLNKLRPLYFPVINNKIEEEIKALISSEKFSTIICANINR